MQEMIDCFNRFFFLLSIFLSLVEFPILFSFLGFFLLIVVHA